MKPDEPFRYVAKVEVKPEVEVKIHKGLEVEKLIREIDDSEVEKELENLREKAMVIESVTDRDAVENGIPVAVVDFFGYVDGETFKGGKGINYTVEVGGGQMIPGWEDELVGMKVGDQRLSTHIPKLTKLPKKLGIKKSNGRLTSKN